MKSSEKTRILVEGAVMVAVATVLGFIKFPTFWPDGGSIDLVMVPIVIFAVRRGLGWGLGVGLAYGFIDFLLGGRGLAWQAIILDYFVAFTLLGLAGVFKGRKNGVVLGSLLGGLARLAAHYLSGATIWAQYMPEKFFGLTMTSPYFYSLLYNGAYMAANIILAIVVCKLLEKPLSRALPAIRPE